LPKEVTLSENYGKESQIDSLYHWHVVKTTITLSDFSDSMKHLNPNHFDQQPIAFNDGISLTERMQKILNFKRKYEPDVLPLLQSVFKTIQFAPSTSGARSQLVYKHTKVGHCEASYSLGVIPPTDLADGFLI